MNISTLLLNPVSNVKTCAVLLTVRCVQHSILIPKSNLVIAVPQSLHQPFALNAAIMLFYRMTNAYHVLTLLKDLIAIDAQTISIAQVNAWDAHRLLVLMNVDDARTIRLKMKLVRGVRQSQTCKIAKNIVFRKAIFQWEIKVFACLAQLLKMNLAVPCVSIISGIMSSSVV